MLGQYGRATYRQIQLYCIGVLQRSSSHGHSRQAMVSMAL
eukprot:SAG31_NODE_46477_length_254_cov_0.793548_1_plen_39_part_10